MNPTTTIVLGSVMVVAGKWAKDETLSIRLAIGAMVSAIGLTLISEMDEKLGRLFGVLILVGIAYAYAPSIIKKAGLA